MFRSCLDEDRAPLAHRNLLALDLQNTCPLEDHVELIVFVRLLPVGSGATRTYTPTSRPEESWTIS
jgi:hypothetical protein